MQYMMEVRQESRKPLMMIKIPGYDPQLGQRFCEAGIPCFDSPERAMHTYALVVRHQRWRQKQTELR
jgi:hypothetical protein